ASGIEKGIGDGACGGGHDFLTRARGALVEPLDHGGVHLRAFFETEDRITVPIETGDIGGIEGDFLGKHAAGGLHQLAADLVFNEAGVHGEAAIDGAVEAADHHATGLFINIDIRDGRAVRCKMRAETNASAADYTRAGRV